jgi:PII-like signaling protein
MESTLPKNMQVLTVYINEDDQWRGQALYDAIMERLKAEGVAGATVERGIEGFGVHNTLRRQNPLHLSQSLPIRIEIVESPEAIAQALQWIETMVSEGLVTVREVETRE